MGGRAPIGPVLQNPNASRAHHRGRHPQGPGTGPHDRHGLSGTREPGYGPMLSLPGRPPRTPARRHEAAVRPASARRRRGSRAAVALPGLCRTGAEHLHLESRGGLVVEHGRHAGRTAQGPAPHRGALCPADVRNPVEGACGAALWPLGLQAGGLCMGPADAPAPMPSEHPLFAGSAQRLAGESVDALRLCRGLARLRVLAR